MSSQAYYMALFSIVIALTMVFATNYGADVVGDSFSMGMVLGVAGLLLIIASISIARRSTHRTE